MVKRVQVPVLGGLRKVISTGQGQAVGTTIAEYGSGTITLAQLRAALGVPQPGSTPSGGGGGGAQVSAAIAPGPGLGGGGPVIGAVPLYLTAPPAMIFEEHVEDHIPVPGPRGVPGPQGPPGMGLIADYEAEEVMLPAPPAPRRVIYAATWPVPGSPNTVFAYCPRGGSIMAVRLMTEGGPGDCVVDIWKKPFSGFPPSGVDSITASAAPEITSGESYEDTTLTGWTRRIDAGDVLAFVLTSSTTFTSVHVSLEVQE
jgi:hypothetical protein